MKKYYVRFISLILTLMVILSFTGVFSSASWISPLAEQGDVSNNGIIEAKDARMILRASARLVILHPPSRKWPKDKVYGDVNGDGKVTAVDARITLRRAAGLPDDITPTPEETYKNEAEIFLSGKYHLIGKTGSGGSFEDWNFATDGKNIYTSLDFDGKPLSFLLLNNKFYLINPANKTYTEISKSFFAQMDFDIEDLAIELPDISDAKLVDTTTIKDGDKDIDVLEYQVEDNSTLKFYLDGTKLNKVDTYSGDTLVSTLIVDSISSNISDVLAIPNGYSERSLFLFLMPLM